MSRPTRAAILCFAAVAVIALSLPVLRSLDDAVAYAIQITRDCETDANAERVGILGAAALAVAAAIVLRHRPAVASLARAVLIFVTGAVFGELLKTMIERLRPDSMPGGATGNAFPSGHIMNTALAAAIVWQLARPAHRLERGAIGVLLVAAVVVQSLSRLWLGAHWATDVPASILLALGWVALVPALEASSPLRLLALGAAAAAAGLFFLAAPTLRLQLGSALDAGAAPIVEIDFDRIADHSLVRGDWQLGHREPIGQVAWLREMKGAIALPEPARQPTRLRIGIRPTTRGSQREPGCVELVVSLNDWSTPPIALVTGWREIRFAPPTEAWRPTGNHLRFRVVADDRTREHRADYGFVGVRYVRAGD